MGARIRDSLGIKQFSGKLEERPKNREASVKEPEAQRYEECLFFPLVSWES